MEKHFSAQQTTDYLVLKRNLLNFVFSITHIWQEFLPVLTFFLAFEKRFLKRRKTEEERGGGGERGRGKKVEMRHFLSLNENEQMHADLFEKCVL